MLGGQDALQSREAHEIVLADVERLRLNVVRNLHKLQGMGYILKLNPCQESIGVV